MTPDANDLCVFAVKRGYIESKEIYCNPLYPTYLSLVEKYQHSPYANGILNNHVAVNPKTDCSLLSDSSEVSFVPMANVQEKTNVVSYDMVAYETVKKGFTVFQRGDLIWAKITPCMQNGKSCIVDKMPTEIGFGSTEFHVIRKRNENVYMPFIWAILSSDDVLKAAQATFSGSAGQQRVSASFIENFPAVLPDYPVQVRLVAELEDKLNLLNGKLQRAYELLHKTPMYLIDRLGLTFDFSATQKITYATTVANIEGRIDADYYSPKFSHFRSQIEALPYRTVSVDDISEKIVSGFAAGKQDQADNLPEDQRVPHLRPFSITPEGELSFETKKYGVAASFLPGADVGDQIELQQIVRRPLADMAGLAQLFLVHDLRVLFEFLCIVCHDEAPFRISVRKGASSVLSGSLFSCLTSCKRARTAAFYARSRFYLNSGAVQISSGRNGSKCPQSLAVPGFPAFHKAA